jgi:hypothetical protein
VRRLRPCRSPSSNDKTLTDDIDLVEAEMSRAHIKRELGARPALVQEFLIGADGEELLPALDHQQRRQFFFDWGAAVGRLHAGKAPCFSNSISQAERCRNTWAELVRERLERLIPANRDAGIVAEGEYVLAR